MSAGSDSPLLGESDDFYTGNHVSSVAQKSPSIVGRLGLIAAALAIAGGGAFAVKTALSDPAGPDSPEEAVSQLFEAVDNDDLFGITDVLLPSERESLIEPSLGFLKQLQRLELVDTDLDPEAQSEFDFTVADLEVSTTAIGDGVARARIIGGTISVEGNSADLPIGDVITDELNQVTPTGLLFEQIVDFGEDDLSLVLVEEDGSWYVSLWYSVAEAAREEAGKAAPDFGNGLTPIGADSPEGAVESLVARMVDLDVEGSIGMLDPAEFRALYDYAPLFLGDARDGVEEIRQQADDSGVAWSLDRLDLSSSDGSGRMVVTIDGGAASAQFDGESFSIDVTDGCITALGPDVDEQFCEGDAIDPELEDFGLDFFSELSFDAGGVTVVERDGRWFVSGMPTIIGFYTDLLAEMEPSDIQNFIDGWNSFAAEGLFGFANEFGMVDEDGDTLDFEDGTFGGVDDGEEIETLPEIPVLQEDLDLFPSGSEPYGNDPEWYFGFESSLRPLAYTSSFDADFNFVEIARFPEGSHETILADLEADVRYESVSIPGLPAEATAFEYPDVDVMIVIGDLVISSWTADDLAPLIAQVQYVAGS